MTEPDDRYRKARIVIVDEDPANVSMLAGILRSEGYENVHDNADPSTTVNLCSVPRFDLILLGITTRGPEGIRVIDRLSHLETDSYPAVVVVLAAEIDEETRLRALEAGARDFLTMPCHASEVLFRIRNALEVRKLHDLQGKQTDGSEGAVHEPQRRLRKTRHETAGRSGRAGEDWLQCLEDGLHDHWHLGRNIILNWSASDEGIDVLAVPHYLAATFSATHPALSTDEAKLVGEPGLAGRQTASFVRSLISGRRQLSPRRLRGVGRLLGVEPIRIPLPESWADGHSPDAKNKMVERYSISFVPNRAVALFDIVRFSRLSPLEQVSQLNSLAYSLNSAHSKLMKIEIDINFARSTTGDGFYVWNRDTGMHANTNLYHFMHIVLADNAIARQKSQGNTTPLLRTGFHVGDDYEFYQAEGLNPTIYNTIVGEVTIELARIVDYALPGQVLVGDFKATLPGFEAGDTEPIEVDSVRFISGLQHGLSKLQGMTLSGEEIRDIKCTLTGARRSERGFAVHRYRVTDKHGYSRNVFNAKINIYRSGGDPIFLGMQEKDLGGFERVDSL